MDMHHLRKKSTRATTKINFSSSVCCQRGETSLSLGLESCNIQQGETNSIWPPEWVIKQQSSSPCCSSEETAIVSPHVERQLFHACLPLCFQLSQDLDRLKKRWGMKSRQRQSRRQGDPQIHVSKGSYRSFDLIVKLPISTFIFHFIVLNSLIYLFVHRNFLYFYILCFFCCICCI